MLTSYIIGVIRCLKTKKAATIAAISKQLGILHGIDGKYKRTGTKVEPN